MTKVRIASLNLVDKAMKEKISKNLNRRLTLIVFNKPDCFDSFLNKDFEISVSNLDWQGLDVLKKFPIPPYPNIHSIRCVSKV